MKKPSCSDPVWSPTTEDRLRAETVAALNRLNVFGVLSGTPERVAQWLKEAPQRLIPAVGVRLGPEDPSPAALKALHAKGQLIRSFRVYVMHGGWPLVDDLLALLWAHRQVYIEAFAD